MRVREHGSFCVMCGCGVCVCVCSVCDRLRVVHCLLDLQVANDFMAGYYYYYLLCCYCLHVLFIRVHTRNGTAAARDYLTPQIGIRLKISMFCCCFALFRFRKKQMNGAAHTEKKTRIAQTKRCVGHECR